MRAKNWRKKYDAAALTITLNTSKSLSYPIFHNDNACHTARKAKRIDFSFRFLINYFSRMQASYHFYFLLQRQFWNFNKICTDWSNMIGGDIRDEENKIK